MKNKQKLTGYPIKVAAQLTGLSIDTLRAWEKRYQAIIPKRQGALRIYAEADVKKLQLLGHLTKRGYPIRTIACLDQKALEALLGSQQGVQSITNEASHVDDNQEEHASKLALAHLKKAIMAFDAADLKEKIERLAAFNEPRDFMYHIVLPLMRWVGEAWHHGQISIAQEHMSSSIVRELLMTMPMQRTKNGTVIMVATLSGEWHELGILMASLLCKMQGCEVLYLGANTPVEEVVKVSEHARVDMVLVGAVWQSDFASSMRPQLIRLESALPTSVDIWLGGFLQLKQYRFSRIETMSSLSDFETRLSEWIQQKQS